MSVIKVRVAADSTCQGRRILTLSCDYPRFIHPQVMTYGLIRKSTSSSRAIPVKRQLELMEGGAFYVPEKLSKNQPGMGSKEELSEYDNALALDLIEAHLEASKRLVAQLGELGVHKQHANRYLEPFLITRCTMTGAVEAFEHLIRQRDVDHEVQPEMRALAVAIKEAISDSTPVARGFHIPYFEGTDPKMADVFYAVARAARDSYLREDVSEEFMSKLKSLWDEGHLGPFEHVAFWTNYFEPMNALTVGASISEFGDDPESKGCGWRMLRHLGFGEVEKALTSHWEAAEVIRPQI
jgi:hypothetical protein